MSYEAALAAFGQHALRSFDLESLLQEACALTAQAVGAPIVQVMELLPNGQELVLRAAVGLPDAWIGQARIAAGLNEAGYALQTREPVISDVQNESRFEISEIVRQAGARTTLNIVIAGADAPFGVLCVDCFDERRFTPDEISFLRLYANLLAAAIERQRSGALMRKLAAEREILLRELQHRVGNDLQIIAALLMFEIQQAQSEEARTRLDNVHARVATLSLVHKRLFAGGLIDQIDLAGYLGVLCQDRLHLSARPPEAQIELDLDLAPVVVDHNRAVAVGLIVNEFLTNSLKYAFPFGRGRISVGLTVPEPGRARLSLSDDGIGLAAGGEAPQGGGLGMQLITLLSGQLDGAVEWSGSPGTRLSLTFPT